MCVCVCVCVREREREREAERGRERLSQCSGRGREPGRLGLGLQREVELNVTGLACAAWNQQVTAEAAADPSCGDGVGREASRRRDV